MNYPLHGRFLECKSQVGSLEFELVDFIHIDKSLYLLYLLMSFKRLLN